MKDFLLICVLLAVGGFGWFACRHLDLFLDARRKARKKHRDDNLPGRDE